MFNAFLLIPAAILCLLILSAFFSGSETALTAASRVRIHHLDRQGNRRAGIVTALINEQAKLLGAILLGNNLVNILASSLATSLFIAWFGDTGVVYATLAMTALVVVFAEVMPKVYAINNADRVALAVSGIMRIIVWALSPITHLVYLLVGGTMRIFGVNVADESQIMTAKEELRGAIDLHAREGGVVRRSRNMLDSILDLDEVWVEEIMIHRSNMEMLDADQPAEELVRQVLNSPYTRLPLWRDNTENIIGVIHSKDLLRALWREDGGMERLDFTELALAPWFVPETTTLREQLNAFRRRRSHFALVVDEYGALMGLVTLEDIIEEIVGDISDEHDVVASGIRAQADGSYLVDGTATIRDLNRQFDWKLPDEEAATVAGLVIHEARVIPEVGQVFTFYDFRFEILRRERNQVTALRIIPPKQPKQETT